MFAAIRSAWPLLLGLAILMLGNGLQGTLLGVRASLEGFSTQTTGYVMTGYYVGFLLGSFIGPTRHPHRRVRPRLRTRIESGQGRGHRALHRSGSHQHQDDAECGAGRIKAWRPLNLTLAPRAERGENMEACSLIKGSLSPLAASASVDKKRGAVT
jgi:hypothetical protein